MKVKCLVSYDSEITTFGNVERDVDKVVVKCKRCGSLTESFGTSEASIKRSLFLLRQGCPRKERNFYVADKVYDWRVA